MFRQRADLHTPAVQIDWLDDVLLVDGPDLDLVLTEVRDLLGPDAEVLDAHRSIVGGIAGFFGREWFTVEARSADPAPTTEPGAETPAPTGTSAPGSPEALDAPSFAAALAEALRAHDEVDAVPEPIRRSDAGAFLALNAPELTDLQLRDRLDDLVLVAPDLPRRGVVAVVGDPDAALDAAETVARLAGNDPADVLVASPTPVGTRSPWMVVGDAADAGRRRQRWVAKHRLTVVAVTLAPGIDGLTWSRELLAALQADQVRLAVPGWRRADEVVARLQGLGHVDAIDLCDPVDDDAALGFLGLPVPVASIAGVPASTDAWLTLLQGAPSAAEALEAVRS